MSSPTQRSLALLRKQGGIVAVTEKWNSFVRRRIDLWGFADLIHAVGDTVTLIQTTSGSNAAARVNKIALIPAADYWLQSPNRKIHVHAWAKRGARGHKKKWDCRVIEIMPKKEPTPCPA